MVLRDCVDGLVATAWPGSPVSNFSGMFKSTQQASRTGVMLTDSFQIFVPLFTNTLVAPRFNINRQASF
jgi:hypothetical protein